MRLKVCGAGRVRETRAGCGQLWVNTPSHGTCSPRGALGLLTLLLPVYALTLIILSVKGFVMIFKKSLLAFGFGVLRSLVIAAVIWQNIPHSFQSPKAPGTSTNGYGPWIYCVFFAGEPFLFGAFFKFCYLSAAGTLYIRRTLVYI